MRLSKVLLAAALGAGLAAPAAAQQQQLTGTLAKIRETGAVTIGFRESSVPFSYLDDQQRPVGFAMDICNHIVERIRTELNMPRIETRLTAVTSATRIPLIANGTVDLECGSTTNNADRQRQVAFAPTHFLTASRFVSKRDSGITGIDSLRGRTVVSTAGTTNIRQLNEANTARGLNINIVAARDHAEAFLMVETDRAAAFVMDDVLLASLVAGARNPAQFQISQEAFSEPEPYGIMLRRDDPQFKALVDRVVGELYRSPRIVEIYNRWFNQPIPPRNLNLNTPLSAEMRRAFQNPTDSPDPAAYRAN
jgi:glutamate/aspartate transport system substrate-binding protein